MPKFNPVNLFQRSAKGNPGSELDEQSQSPEEEYLAQLRSAVERYEEGPNRRQDLTNELKQDIHDAHTLTELSEIIDFKLGSMKRGLFKRSKLEREINRAKKAFRENHPEITVASLDAEIQRKLIDELNKLKGELNTLERSNKMLIDKMNDSVVEFANVEKQKKELEQQLEELKNANRPNRARPLPPTPSAGQGVAALKRELDELKQEQQNLVMQNNELVETKAALEIQLQEAQSTVAVFAEENQQLQLELAEAKQRAEMAESKLIEAQTAKQRQALTQDAWNAGSVARSQDFANLSIEKLMTMLDEHIEAILHDKDVIELSEIRDVVLEFQTLILEMINAYNQQQERLKTMAKYFKRVIANDPAPDTLSQSVPIQGAARRGYSRNQNIEASLIVDTELREEDLILSKIPSEFRQQARRQFRVKQGPIYQLFGSPAGREDQEQSLRAKTEVLQYLSRISELVDLSLSRSCGPEKVNPATVKRLFEVVKEKMAQLLVNGHNDLISGTISNNAAVEALVVTNLPSSSAPPPPPLPQNMLQVGGVNLTQTAEQKPLPQPAPSQDSARGALLAAIEKGTELKSVKKPSDEHRAVESDNPTQKALEKGLAKMKLAVGASDASDDENSSSDSWDFCSEDEEKIPTHQP